MRQLHPVPLDDIDPIEVYGADQRTPSSDRPWVLINMVASIDGATAVEGRSGGLGGPGDVAVFQAIRAVADVIVAAAGTVRAENYGPPAASATIRSVRAARGQAELARLAVLTNRLDLDPEARLFGPTDGERPLILTSGSAPPAARTRLDPVAEILTVGDERVDLSAALAALSQHDARVVLLEGGPSLIGQFVAQDLIDELCITISPLMAGGESARLAHGPAPVRPIGFDLARILADEDGTLFLRYVRPAAVNDPPDPPQG